GGGWDCWGVGDRLPIAILNRRPWWLFFFISLKKKDLPIGSNCGLSDGSMVLNEKRTGMSRYETVIIYRPDLSSSQVEATVAEAAESLKKQGATIAKNEFWGLRNTAFPINDHKKAYYALLHIETTPAVMKEFERLLPLNDAVMRFLTVAVEEFEQGPSAILRENSSNEDELGDVESLSVDLKTTPDEEVAA
ncbi:MAG: 30S ribosomal protein S6, partial [Holosporaceae bacterium]